VIRQTEKDFELLIVDNNRKAAPVADISYSWRDDPRVRVLRSSTARNGASARNVGLAAARGDWITYLDDDDAYRPNKLERQLNSAGSSPLILCGALFHMRGRTRCIQVAAGEFRGDELLNLARWNTPFIMHKRRNSFGFDEELAGGGDDLHFAQGVIAAFGLVRVPVVAECLVDVYQDRRDDRRTNLQSRPGWIAARRTLFQFGSRYSRGARRLFALRALVTRAKLEGQTRRCAILSARLLRLGGAAQIRFALNAVIVSTGIAQGRWVT
jgi:glycosyltransferase involved in cell wall biosynthesis